MQGVPTYDAVPQSIYRIGVRKPPTTPTARSVACDNRQRQLATPPSVSSHASAGDTPERQLACVSWRHPRASARVRKPPTTPTARSVACDNRQRQLATPPSVSSHASAGDTPERQLACVSWRHPRASARMRQLATPPSVSSPASAGDTPERQLVCVPWVHVQRTLGTRQLGPARRSAPTAHVAAPLVAK